MKTLIPTPVLRACVHVFAAALLTLSLSACLTLESVNCSPELSCRGGMVCAAADDVCISAMSPSCGNGIPEAGEACDHGNLIDKDGCSADCKSDETCGNGVVDVSIGEVCDTRSPENGGKCSPDCKSLQGCGNLYVDLGEECDDGNDNPNDDCIDCKLARCGDGLENSGKEECDPRGNAVNCDLDCTRRACGDGTVNLAAGEECEGPGQHPGFFCTSTCKISRCGDGVIDSEAGEVCDDSNTVTETECPYGIASCTRCRADCREELTVTKGTFCGDGVRNGPEVCDDGNIVTEQNCPYGSPTCKVCASDCSAELLRTGEYCGDGIIKNGIEACDDGNADACGTCSADCKKVQRDHARGQIEAVAGNAVIENEKIIMSDGTKTATIEFTLEDGNSQRTGYRRLEVDDDDSASDVAKEIRNAIESLKGAGDLNITPTLAGNIVHLRHTEMGTHGNRIIIQSSNRSIKASGMIGGTGRNCPALMSCKTTDDCESSLACRNKQGSSGMHCVL